MRRLVNRFYNSHLSGILFHTTPYLLRRELRGCDSALDLGCGPSSPLSFVSIRHSLGVEIFEPYLRSSKAKGVHDDYVLANLTKLEFRANSFDAIIMIGVIEHLQRKDGYVLLKKAEAVARKKIIITCPNGFLSQGAHDKIPFQVHNSGWSPADFRKMKFRVHGLSGPRALRKSNEPKTQLTDHVESDLISTIRFRPRLFWIGVAALFQIVIYRFPSLVFELLAVGEPS